jgi:uncharacterized protein
VALLALAWASGPALALDRPPGAHVVDAAGLLDGAARARLERLLGALLRDADVELVVASVPALAGADLAEATGALLERWAVGRRTRGDRGLLLLLAVREARARLAVSYALEPLLPDGFVGYVGREQLAPYVREGRLAEGLEATVELLVARVTDAVASRDVEGRTPPGGAFRGGGAGAEAPVAGTALAAAPASPEARRRFGPQPTPELAWARFLELHRQGIRDPELGLYDEAARRRLRSRPPTEAAMRHVADLYAGRPAVVRVRGSRAAIVFLEDPEHRLAPWFFHRTPEGWQLDGAMYPGVIAYNHLNQWRFARRDHPYAFAFHDFTLDRHGFATPPR